jgi:hypothetical protein
MLVNTKVTDLPKVKDLPEDIQRIILEYMHLKYKLFLTKRYYLQYHKIILEIIPKNNIENYIRAMVRQDNSFVFHRLVSENWYKWLNTTNYCYRGRIYLNYIDFLNEYCFDQCSPKCKQVLYCLINN